MAGGAVVAGASMVSSSPVFAASSMGGGQPTGPAMTTPPPPASTTNDKRSATWTVAAPNVSCTSGTLQISSYAVGRRLAGNVSVMIVAPSGFGNPYITGANTATFTAVGTGPGKSGFKRGDAFEVTWFVRYECIINGQRVGCQLVDYTYRYVNQANGNPRLAGNAGNPVRRRRRDLAHPEALRSQRRVNCHLRVNYGRAGYHAARAHDLEGLPDGPARRTQETRHGRSHRRRRDPAHFDSCARESRNPDVRCHGRCACGHGCALWDWSKQGRDAHEPGHGRRYDQLSLYGHSHARVGGPTSWTFNSVARPPGNSASWPSPGNGNYPFTFAIRVRCLDQGSKAVCSNYAVSGTVRINGSNASFAPAPPTAVGTYDMTVCA